MSFDFDGYLKHLDPLQSYQITLLTGGVVNVTARAVKISRDMIHSGRFSGHKSVILKYAPPFVAGVGPEAVLTQTRQVTEATILSCFNGPLEYVKRYSGVTVPDLLHHDRESHVVVMSDLGQVPNLSESFSVLGGHTPNNVAKSFHFPKDNYDQEDRPELQSLYYRTLGARLGTFFAHLHSQKTLAQVSALINAGVIQLSSSELLSSVHEFAIKPLKARLESFADLLPTYVSALTLYERIENDWLRSTSDDEKSFILGDCWTGAILVPPFIPNHSPSNSTDLDVGVIDWEFAAIARAPHGDIPQLLAHLELFRCAAVWRNSQYHISVLDVLISSLINAYKTISTNQKEAWTDSDGQRGSERRKSLPDPTSLRARIIRGALLAFASEILNCAFWKVWPCLEPSCPALLSNESGTEAARFGSSEVDIQITTKRRPSFQTYSSRPSALRKSLDFQDTDQRSIVDEMALPHDEERLHLCPLVRRMAESAIWLICRAGKNEAEMCQSSNWEELSRGPPVSVDHQLRRKHTAENEGPLEKIDDCDRQLAGHVGKDTSDSLLGDKRLEERPWLLDLFT